MTETPSQLELLVREYTAGDKPRVLYVYNGPISDEHVETFSRAVDLDEGVDASLFLCTLGGNPHAAYRLTRFLLDSHKSLRLLVAGPCKSAGTLVAIGSHSLAFAPRGELGPLDMQITKPEELVLQSSGLVIAEALAQVTESASSAFARHLVALTRAGLSTRVAARIATNLTTGLFKEIVAQIEPLRLGEAQRAISIATGYGDRLRTENLRAGALDQLVLGYPDHAFVIDRKEASRLFASAEVLTDTESRIAAEFGDLVRDPRQRELYVVNANREYGVAEGGQHDDEDEGGRSPDPVREEARRSPADPEAARAGAARNNGAE